MWAIRQVSKSDQASLLRDARDYALLHGLVLRYRDMNNDNCVGHVPLTPLPSPYPEKLYQECLDLQPIINKLMMRIANDSDFINETLRPIVNVDEFTRNLLEVENTVRREGRSQPIMSCINRSDYMLDKISSQETSLEALRVRQVEVNAIASAMSAHSYNVRSMQDYLMSKYKITIPQGASLPPNDSLDIVANGLIDAFDAYDKSSAHILLVCETDVLNFSDQLIIETRVHRAREDIRFIRCNFAKLPDQVNLGPNKELLVNGGKEIAVVYFRYGYDPCNYNFDGAWNVRLMLERSRAIKCPSINFHLSGAKKFQQVLNNKSQLERYLDSKESAKLERVFCRFWSIESEASEGLRLATSPDPPQRLVLKPQREGGGHNIFGTDIKPFVEQLANPKDRAQYIMMEFIDGPREYNLLLLRDDNSQEDATRLDHCDQLISELGIYGSILATDKSEVLSNRAGGYLVRSKRWGVDEGGVSAGYAGISNLILLNDTVQDIGAFFIK